MRQHPWKHPPPPHPPKTLITQTNLKCQWCHSHLLCASDNQSNHLQTPTTFLQRNLHAVDYCFPLLSNLLRGGDVIQDGVDRFLRVVACHSRFDVGQQLFVALHHLIVITLKAKCNIVRQSKLGQRFYLGSGSGGN